MTQIEVGDLTFSFPNGCNASKYDDWAFYRNQFHSVAGGSKAVDILCLAGGAACLIEVKDYRLHRRTKLIDLGDEVASKVRDTLSGLAAASANANNNDERALARRLLAQRCWRVVFHLEQPRVSSRLRPRPFNTSDVVMKLRSQLKAIDAHPVVLDRRDMRADIPWTVQ